MKYKKSEAKEYAREHMQGTWGATYTPFTPDYEIDEQGYRHNLRYCIFDLEIEGMFVNGLMGESFSQTLKERQRLFEISVEEAQGRMATMLYTSAPSLADTLRLTVYAQDLGADYVIIINPKFYFGAMSEEGVFQYYRYLAERVDIGIALFNQIEHGYLMSPALIARIAELDNIIAIKNIAPGPHLRETRILCGREIVVSEAREDTWLANMTIGGQQAFVATPDPYCLQSKKLKLLGEYTRHAAAGEIAEAWECSRRLEPIRSTLQSVTFPGKIQASYKYWTQFLGMEGGEGRVRLPQQELTAAEKDRIKSTINKTELL
jgi:4-hydroxy-tetrahydrodipicolinate synthase